MDGLGPYGNGKNALGLGKNVTGLLLGGLFFAVYVGSSWGTKKWVMSKQELAGEKPRYFRDVVVTSTDDDE